MMNNKKIDGTCIPAVSAGARVISRQKGQVEIHIFHKILLFSGTGEAVIRAVDGVKTLDEIVEELSRQYRADAAAIYKDVVNFVQELIDKNVLTLVG